MEFNLEMIKPRRCLVLAPILVPNVSSRFHNGISNMAIRISGTVIRGERNATKNNAVLIPVLAKHFPEIANCGPFGTINVKLDQPLNKSRADIWTRRIIWKPVKRPESRVEAFGFIKIKFECPLTGPAYECWTILPEGSTTTYCDNQLEIIADFFIEGVAYGANCAVDIDHRPSVAAPPSFGAIYGMSFR
jgi:CTP-dependent riboflavin kinase